MASYDLVQLQFPPGGEYAYAYAINKWGAIAGQVTFDVYDDPPVHVAAVVWHDYGADQYDAQSTDATFWAINDIEDLLGGRTRPNSGAIDAYAFAFTTFPQQYLDISALVGGTSTQAIALNNARIAVMSRGTAPYGMFTVDLANPAGSLVEIGLAPGSERTGACDINDEGIMAGTTVDANDVYDAFFYRNGVFTKLPGIWNTQAINESGIIVGGKTFGSSTEMNAFSYDINATTPDFVDLGHLPGHTSSSAYAINSSGHIVGHSNPASGDAHAFFWNGSTMSDLNDLVELPSGMVLQYASDINDAGQICCMGKDADDRRVPIRLDPIPLSLQILPSYHSHLFSTILSAGSVNVIANGIPIRSIFEFERLTPAVREEAIRDALARMTQTIADKKERASLQKVLEAIARRPVRPSRPR